MLQWLALIHLAVTVMDVMDGSIIGAVLTALVAMAIAGGGGLVAWGINKAKLNSVERELREIKEILSTRAGDEWVRKLENDFGVHVQESMPVRENIAVLTNDMDWVKRWSQTMDASVKELHDDVRALPMRINGGR